MSPSVVTIAEAIDRLREHDKLGRELVFSPTLPGRPARYAELAEPLPAAARRRPGGLGVERLFSHQAEGIDAVAAGENVLVTTPTASGKSLVFHLPPLMEAARGGPGRALFLFPLKALGQDQRAKFDALAQAAGLTGPDGADGEEHDPEDSRPGGDLRRRHAARRAGRDPPPPPRVLVTNPDMLHLGILSHWSGWTEYLQSVRWIVLDELHTYRGIFGSHFHHVLQRLLRVCRSEGAEPTLIASSATAANAGEFAETLTGCPFHWVRESGAPREARHMLLFRPEASPYTTALALFVELLRSGAKTIVFTKARRITELLYSWLRRQDPELARRVASYRSGFLPEERRSIEERLFAGQLDGVISTSALEMGIDVGGLDACILVGYPGSVMATWQRSGRAGRGGRESLTALVAMPDALDQYFLDHPAELLERPCERLIVDPANEPVARAHLVCAAAELPLTPGRDGGRRRLSRAPRAAGGCHGRGAAAAGLGRRLRGAVSARAGPSASVNLRGGGETYDIVDAETGEMVGTVDGVRVLHECHPGAIYLHGGRQYQVETLDLDHRHVLVRRGSVDYFTTPLTEKETEILEVLDERRDGRGLAARLGRLKVTERVVGFERKRIQSQEVIGQHALELPPTEFETVGLWWAAPRGFEETLRHARGALPGRAPRHRARGDLALPDPGAVRPRRHRRHLLPPAPAGRLRRGVHLRRPPGRRGDRRARLPGPAGAARPGARAARRLPLRERLPVVHPVPQVRQRQPAAGQAGGGAGAAAAARPGGAGARSPPRRWSGAERRGDRGRAAEDGPAGGAAGRPAGGAAPEAVVAGPGGGRGTRRAPPAAGRSGLESLDGHDHRALRPRDPPLGRRGGRLGQRPPDGDLRRRGLVLEEGRFEVFREERVGELAELLTSADLVVGFNVKRFDYQVLSGYTGVDYGRMVRDPRPAGGGAAADRLPGQARRPGGGDPGGGQVGGRAPVPGVGAGGADGPGGELLQEGRGAAAGPLSARPAGGVRVASATRSAGGWGAGRSGARPYRGGQQRALARASSSRLQATISRPPGRSA